MGIDLGNAYIKASVATATSPLHMASNVHGKRYMPFVFAFWNRTKSSNYSSLQTWKMEDLDSYNYQFGFFAKEQCLKFPRTCIFGLPNMSDTYFQLKGYEVLALELDYFVKSVKKAENIQDRLQVVISIPPGMDPRDRTFIRLACRLAGIELIGFIDSTTAPAYTYSLERQHIYSNESLNVGFVDIGKSGSRVEIFNFDGRDGQNTVKQLAVVFNNTMGGHNVDQKLAEIVSKKYNIDISNLKIRTNLENDVSAAKESLAMHPSVELLWDSDDEDEPRNLTITRSDLEESGQELNKTVVSLIENALKMANLQKVDRCELAGGQTRSIFLRDPIINAFGVEEVSRTLSQDHFNALAAGYESAELSPQFTVQKQVNKSLMITIPSWALFGKNLYPIFNRGDEEGGSPSVETVLSDQHTYSIVTSRGEFAKFNVKGHKKDRVEISFIHNYFLMPIPYTAVSKNNELSIDFVRLPWEPTNESINHSQVLFDNFIYIADQRRHVHKLANDLEEFLLQLKHVLPSSGEHTNILNSHIEWYSNLVTEAKAEDYKTRLDELHERFDSICESILEKETKPKSLKKIKKTVCVVKELLSSARTSPLVNRTALSIAEESLELAERDLVRFENDEKVKSQDIIRTRQQLKDAALPIKKFMWNESKKAVNSTKLGLM
ncbi:dnaK protein [Trichomonas vaginalis G3]|uniref:DnaK protein n=1 Tax=Trichomonas vaginalis (strain ATCC PRA-98 / G3) TaxID=412133 RepID=A2ENM6_TRIV3|nr:ATP binding [Trichomonas vaginalis G3]EAY05726.1 dnaK protein [Trichomonas vaginalis G3]KAI5535165.1 ATP binding [Trichomonas vaginalis G3]|eukprot:XP_001317949.1 dnaK protein [Trichomonas vaginalis G3]